MGATRLPQAQVNHVKIAARLCRVQVFRIDQTRSRPVSARCLSP